MTLVPINPSPPPVARFRTAEEWWDALGQVPLHRIVFDPPPGTATEADVLRLDDHEDRLCELVDGTLVEKTMGYEESLIAARIIYFLQAFVMPRKLGLVSGPDGMMRILPRRVRIPDVGYIAFARLPDGQRPRDRVPAVCPDLAVEVISEHNTRREMATKLAEYFQSGTRLVWYVDPPSRTVEVFRSPESPVRLTEADTIDGGVVLPGFAVRVGEFFDID